MPIYSYRCTACGRAKDVLQRISDPVLTTCPYCGAEAFSKQVTAAGFQLKGSGWYVTDFKDGGAAAKKNGDGAATPASSPATTANGAKSDTAKSDTPKPDSAKPDATSAAAGGGGGAGH